ncbi:WD40-repeat-containing domain protein [Suillus spraguei]|nr:WD40-repeat-containing domain protein [Suillus spraguei]
MADQVELSSPPFDSIFQVRFSPTNPDHLLTVRFYDVATNEQKPNLTIAQLLNPTTEKVTSLGQHSNSVTALSYAREINTLISGSWDQSLRFWDPRAPKAEVSDHTLPERVYHMDVVNNTLVVSIASRLFHIYDVRMSEPAQTRKSSLKFMTRSLACMADGQGKSILIPLVFRQT